MKHLLDPLEGSVQELDPEFDYLMAEYGRRDSVGPGVA